MAIRILDILDFSNHRNPQADSGVQLKKELIKAILRSSKDFFFYLLVPAELVETFQSEFQTKNIIIIPVNFVPRQQGGAFHFDVRELSFARQRKSSLAPEAVVVMQEQFAIVNSGDLKLFDELSLLGSEHAAAARVDELIQTDPTLRGRLQVVPAFELAA